MDTSQNGAGHAGADPTGAAPPAMDVRGAAGAVAEDPYRGALPLPPAPGGRATGADAHPAEYAEGPRPRGPITGPQRAGALLLAAAALAGAGWYVPRITAADSHTFTGTVASTGVIGLNFASDGRVGQVLVRSGQQVKPGQVLAVENSSPPMAALNADRAAIAADLAGEGELRAASGPAGGPAAIAAATARLAKDQAQLASDQAHLAGAEIVAPAGGTVVAVNGQAGETVSASGIRTYPPQFSLPSAQPAFSLLPEGPRPSVAGRAAAPAMPVVALRITSDWLVDMLVPQTAVAAIRPGQRVIVAVPAVRLSRVKGHVEAVSPAPVATSSGIAYQVSVSVTGRRRAVPFSGMTANVQIVP